MCIILATDCSISKRGKDGERSLPIAIAGSYSMAKGSRSLLRHAIGAPIRGV